MIIYNHRPYLDTFRIMLTVTDKIINSSLSTELLRVFLELIKQSDHIRRKIELGRPKCIHDSHKNQLA